MSSENRFIALDGLRGVAILWVLSFHLLVRWSDLVTYNINFNDLFIFHSGYFGVYLFFMISGYVIFLTLFKCSNFSIFVKKRWLRLFPAMFIASIFIYCSSIFFSERPNGLVQLKNLIPGLLFVEPYILEKLTGISTGELEGAFWSLYIEFKFYLIAGILYFYTGPRISIFIIALFFIAWSGLDFLVKMSVKTLHQEYILTHSILEIIGAPYFGWFSLGAILYFIANNLYNRTILYFSLSIIISFLIFNNFISQHSNLIGISLTLLIFIVTLYSSIFQRILSMNFLLFFGFISYPLYLIHENLGISIIRKFSSAFTCLYTEIYAAIAFILITFIAYIIARYIEKPCRGIFSRIVTIKKSS